MLVRIMSIKAQIQLCDVLHLRAAMVMMSRLLCIQIESGDVLHERAWSVYTEPQGC